MAERLFNPPPAKTVRIPKTHPEWVQLMRQAIEQAEASQHRALPGLRAALASGNAERHLRTLGIISPADIEREFPKIP